MHLTSRQHPGLNNKSWDNVFHMPEIPDLCRGNIRKEYQEFTLEQLDHGPVFTSSEINWQQLVEEMLGHEITNPADVKVQVYFHEQLDEIVTEISEEYRSVLCFIYCLAISTLPDILPGYQFFT
nr:uncharacterized protein LOC128692827 [Cherax quadricarinatus]